MTNEEERQKQQGEESRENSKLAPKAILFDASGGALYNPTGAEIPEKKKHKYLMQWWYWLRTDGISKATLFVIVVYTVATICLYRAAGKQVKALQEQNCIQREASMNSERAWVGLEGVPEVDMSSLQERQFSARIQLPLKNFGKGPAFNVVSDSRFATHGHVQDTIESSCNLIFPFVGIKPTSPVSSSGDLSKTQWGEVVFPGQPYISGDTFQGTPDELLGKEVFLVGCIVYRDQFQRPHWTRFSFTTGPFVTQVVHDASAFHHLQVSSGNNYTDDIGQKDKCYQSPSD